MSDLLALDDVIDILVPRESNELVRHIQQNTRIPVLGHADESVMSMWMNRPSRNLLKPSLWTQTDYPAACNAMELCCCIEIVRMLKPWWIVSNPQV